MFSVFKRLVTSNFLLRSIFPLNFHPSMLRSVAFCEKQFLVDFEKFHLKKKKLVIVQIT